ncbi:MAG: hypothetical protein ABSC64_02210 [Candidatus Korobacteraceae bacterium]|jgi:hypothetical protein
MNMWKAKGEKAITVARLLPWVKEQEETQTLSEKKRGAVNKLSGNIAEVPHEKRAPKKAIAPSVAEITEKYLLTAGKKKEDLTPEELAEITVKAINWHVAQEGGGRQIFGTFPQEWSHFDEKPKKWK